MAKTPGKPAGSPLNLRVAPDLKRRFRVACADKGVRMTDVLVEAIEHFVTIYERGKLPPAKPRK